MAYPLIRSDVGSGYREMGKTISSGIKNIGDSVAKGIGSAVELDGIEKDKKKFRQSQEQVIGEWKENLKGLPVEQWDKLEGLLRTDDVEQFGTVNKNLYEWYSGTDGNVSSVPLGKAGVSGFGFADHGKKLAEVSKAEKEQAKKSKILSDAWETLKAKKPANTREIAELVPPEVANLPEFVNLQERYMTEYQQEKLKVDRINAQNKGTPKPDKPYDNTKDYTTAYKNLMGLQKEYNRAKNKGEETPEDLNEIEVAKEALKAMEDKTISFRDARAKAVKMVAEANANKPPEVINKSWYDKLDDKVGGYLPGGTDVGANDTAPTPIASQPAQPEKTLVMSPEGKKGYVPNANLQKALSQGYTVVK